MPCLMTTHNESKNLCSTLHTLPFDPGVYSYKTETPCDVRSPPVLGADDDDERSGRTGTRISSGRRPGRILWCRMLVQTNWQSREHPA